MSTFNNGVACTPLFYRDKVLSAAILLQSYSLQCTDTAITVIYCAVNAINECNNATQCINADGINRNRYIVNAMLGL